MLSCLWDDAYKRTLAANRKEEPLLSEWSFTICLTLYKRKLNVLSVLLNKTFPSFLPVNHHHGCLQHFAIHSKCYHVEIFILFLFLVIPGHITKFEINRQ